MTIGEHYNAFKEAVDNGCGNLEVYARKLLPIDFINIVSEWSSGNKKEYAEIIYEDTYDEKQDAEEILNRKGTCDLSREFGELEKKNNNPYRIGYTQQLADDLQFYIKERQVMFDAWRKEGKESAHVIKGLLDCMRHRMRVNETERCRDIVAEVINNAENYVNKLESDGNYEIMIPAVKEKQIDYETDTEKKR